MTEKKKQPEKKPLDMTTDEAIEFLFGQEGAQTLKQYVREKVNPPPSVEEKQSKRSVKSSRKNTSRQSTLSQVDNHPKFKTDVQHTDLEL